MKESTHFRFCWSVIKNCIYINKSVKLFTCKGNYIKSLKFNWKQNSVGKAYIGMQTQSRLKSLQYFNKT